MNIQDIFNDNQILVFIVTNDDDDNISQCTIEPTSLQLLPDEENFYFIKALQVEKDKETHCYLGVNVPERIAEIVIMKGTRGEILIKSVYDCKHTIIPAIASECFGVYELFYAKENPQIGIDILRNGMEKAINKNIVAEDLGYILRDEGRSEEAIEAFEISAAFGPSSSYTFLELSNLYMELGQVSKALAYKREFEKTNVQLREIDTVFLVLQTSTAACT